MPEDNSIHSFFLYDKGMLSQSSKNIVHNIFLFVVEKNSDLSFKITPNTSPDTHSATEQLFLSQSLLKYTNNKNNKER